jgi:hypothetical protein
VICSGGIHTLEKEEPVDFCWDDGKGKKKTSTTKVLSIQRRGQVQFCDKCCHAAAENQLLDVPSMKLVLTALAACGVRGTAINRVIIKSGPIKDALQELDWWGNKLHLR